MSLTKNFQGRKMYRWVRSRVHVFHVKKITPSTTTTRSPPQCHKRRRQDTSLHCPHIHRTTNAATSRNSSSNISSSSSNSKKQRRRSTSLALPSFSSSSFSVSSCAEPHSNADSRQHRKSNFCQGNNSRKCALLPDQTEEQI